MRIFSHLITPNRISASRCIFSRGLTTSGAIEKLVRSSVKKSIGEPATVQCDGDARVFFVKTPRFGDYQCNIALGLAKSLKVDSKQMAQTIVDNIEANDILDASKTSVSGPGFINISLRPEYVNMKLASMLADPARVGVPVTKDPKRIIVDFSSPNIAKEMHVVSIYG